MRLTISVCRKVGMPHYGSEGASCEVAVDVAERTVSESPDSLRDEIRRAYALCERSVAEQLARHQVEPQPQPQPQPAPRPEPQPRPESPDSGHDSDRLPSQGRGPATPRPRQPVAEGEPTSGRALFARLRAQDEAHGTELLRHASRWARLRGYPDRMVQWDTSQVAAAHAEITNFRASARGSHATSVAVEETPSGAGLEPASCL